MLGVTERKANTCGVHVALRTMGVKYILNTHYRVGTAPDLDKFWHMKRLYDIWEKKECLTQIDFDKLAEIIDRETCIIK